MIDVGAAHGDSFRPFAKYGWKIYGFEPNPINRNELIKIFGHLPNVHIDSRAVASESKSHVEFYSSDVSFGIGSLQPFHESHKLSNYVDIITLSDFIKETKINKVDFLKIDSEGFDYFVLKGFPWAEQKPLIILCEFEDKKTVKLGYTWKDMANFLYEKEYHVLVSEWKPIINYSMKHVWSKICNFPCELDDSKGWGNLIAISDEELVKPIMNKFKEF